MEVEKRCEVRRELFYNGAIPGYQMRGKIPFEPHIINICVRMGEESGIYGFKMQWVWQQ